MKNTDAKQLKKSIPCLELPSSCLTCPCETGLLCHDFPPNFLDYFGYSTFINFPACLVVDCVDMMIGNDRCLGGKCDCVGSGAKGALRQQSSEMGCATI